MWSFFFQEPASKEDLKKFSGLLFSRSFKKYFVQGPATNINFLILFQGPDLIGFFFFNIF